MTPLFSAKNLQTVTIIALPAYSGINLHNIADRLGLWRYVQLFHSSVVRAMNVFNWKCHFSGFCSSENFRVIFQKWHNWLRRHYPASKFRGQSVQRGRSCAWVALWIMFPFLFVVVAYTAKTTEPILTRDGSYGAVSRNVVSTRVSTMTDNA